MRNHEVAFGIYFLGRLAIIISGVQPGDDHPTEETLCASMVMGGNSWVLGSMVY